MAHEKRIALVTGGTAGLGEDIALELQHQGFEVGVCGRRQDRLDAMRARGVDGLRCDIGTPGEVEHLKSWVVERFGGLDALVNCAGVALPRCRFVDLDFEQVEKVMRINVLGTMRVTQALLPLVQQRRGSIVNFSSTLSQRPRAGTVAYAASKGAVESFTRALAIEAAEHGVRVHCVAPALVRSEIYLAAGMSAHDYDQLVASRAAEFPLKRIGEPEDVSSLVAYLVSDKAGWLTGQTYFVDGGGMLR